MVRTATPSAALVAPGILALNPNAPVEWGFILTAVAGLEVVRCDASQRFRAHGALFGAVSAARSGLRNHGGPAGQEGARHVFPLELASARRGFHRTRTSAAEPAVAAHRPHAASSGVP